MVDEPYPQGCGLPVRATVGISWNWGEIPAKWDRDNIGMGCLWVGWDRLALGAHPTKKKSFAG